jgi:carbon monoxide dehydrogenase subunit G
LLLFGCKSFFSPISVKFSVASKIISAYPNREFGVQGQKSTFSACLGKADIRMEMNSQQHIAASRDRVWAALNDLEMLRNCIPGCETLERLADDELAATVVLKVGPVKATFKGKVRFENVIEPTSMTLVGEGSGGIAGHARGSADVTLTEDAEGTMLTYVVDAQVGGKIAQLGARLIQSTSQKLAGEFFNTFEKQVAAALVE